jgi:REP element-mobilizing transposase RayT
MGVAYPTCLRMNAGNPNAGFPAAERRNPQRTFLLTPSVEVTTAVRFAYLLSAMKFGIQLHAVVVMSNHVHMVCTDPEGNLPKFMEEAKGLSPTDVAELTGLTLEEIQALAH